jgi:hypothetical protein
VFDPRQGHQYPFPAAEKLSMAALSFLAVHSYCLRQDALP